MHVGYSKYGYEKHLPVFICCVFQRFEEAFLMHTKVCIIIKLDCLHMLCLQISE